MPRLLVLLKTAATNGKTSFLMVEKSNTESTVSREPNDLSTMECVGDSNPICIIGSISALCQSCSRRGSAMLTLFKFFAITVLPNQRHVLKNDYKSRLFRGISFTAGGFALT